MLNRIVYHHDNEFANHQLDKSFDFLVNEFQKQIFELFVTNQPAMKQMFYSENPDRKYCPLKHWIPKQNHYMLFDLLDFRQIMYYLTLNPKLVLELLMYHQKCMLHLYNKHYEELDRRNKHDQRSMVQNCIILRQQKYEKKSFR